MISMYLWGGNEVVPYLESLPQGKVVIACVKSSGSVTVSGDAGVVSEFISRIETRGDGTPLSQTAC
jgi:hypothetical protein